MGFGTDWKQAVEKVKGMHVEPGRQPEMVRDLLHYAVDYLGDKHDLITVPAGGASESFRMVMLSPERQLGMSPFFLAARRSWCCIRPTPWITNPSPDDARQQHSFLACGRVPRNDSRPQPRRIMGSRFANYRSRLGDTPFLGEGWPLYWEMILYDKGFLDTPEERVGSLFWRMHRSAQIVFSLKFHMGQWSPQECIDFLVNDVGPLVSATTPPRKYAGRSRAATVRSTRRRICWVGCNYADSARNWSIRGR